MERTRRGAIGDVYARFLQANDDDAFVLPADDSPLADDPEAREALRRGFLRLFEKGLIFHRRDDAEGADEQPQWYFRRSAYNAENLSQLQQLTAWSDAAVESQTTALQPVEGVELEVHGLDGSSLTVFTPFREAIDEAAFVLISPRHGEAEQWGASGLEVSGASNYFADTGVLAQLPGHPDLLPVLMSDRVDRRFGVTAVLGIPSHDSADQEIAERLVRQQQSLKIRARASQPDIRSAHRCAAGDVAVSQRRPGVPIPIVHCLNCGEVATPDDLDGTADSAEIPCPSCGGPANPDREAIDDRLGSGWFGMTAAVAGESERPRSPARLLVGGADDGELVLTLRALAKALRDLDELPNLPDGEPFRRLLACGPASPEPPDGESRVTPEALDAAEADAVRFAALGAARPDSAIGLNEHSLRHAEAFLSRVRDFAGPRLTADAPGSSDASVDRTDRMRARLAFWSDTGIKRVTEQLEDLAMQRVTQSLTRMVERLESFEQQAERQRGKLDDSDREALGFALSRFVQLLAPVCPDLAEELWEQAERDDRVGSAPWPRPVGPPSGGKSKSAAVTG